MRFRIGLYAAVLGFFDIVAQLVLVREMMVWSLGNELSMGIALGAWLFWMGAGALLGGVWMGRSRRARWWLLGLSVWVAAAVPAVIVLIREFRHVAGMGQGEILPVMMVLRYTVAALAPVCFPAGMLFAAAVRWAEEADGAGAGGRIYAAELAGSLAGAVVFTFLLAPYMAPMAAAGRAGICIVGATLLIDGAGVRRAAWAALAIGIVGAAIVLPRAENTSRRVQWGKDLYHVEDSAYGNIAVLKDKGQFSFFESGLLSGSTPDPVASEFLAHLPLLSHPAPQRVFLVGGDALTVREILKHPVRQVVMAELDPRVLRLKRRYADPASKRALADPRVTVIATDARRYLARNGPPFDVIIVNLPDPQTLQINRYYTLEFYRTVARRLNRGGILMTAAPYKENYSAAAPTDLLVSIFRTVRESLPMILIVPELRTVMLASRDSFLEYNPEPLVRRMKARGIVTQHFGEPYIRYLMSPARVADSLNQFTKMLGQFGPPENRIDFIYRTLRRWPGVPLNRDIRPISMYYQQLVTGGFYPTLLIRWMSAARSKAVYVAGMIAAVALALLAIAAGRLGRTARPGVGYAMAATGFSGMALEVMLLLLVQCFYGVVYQYMGLVLAAFMGGTAAGAFVGRRILRTPGSARIGLLAGQFLFAGFVLGLVAAVSRLSTEQATSAAAALVWGGIVAAGVLVGFTYPAALGTVAEGAASAGWLYGVDLIGACAGALTAAVLLVPVAGFVLTLSLLAWIHLGGAAAVALTAWRRTG